MKRDALIADVLFGASAALAVTSVTLFVVGSTVKVSPTAGGVAISGELP